MTINVWGLKNDSHHLLPVEDKRIMRAGLMKMILMKIIQWKINY